MSHEEFQKWINEGPKEIPGAIEEAEATFNMEVEHAMDILADCIPYDDPNYHENLRKAAEQYVKESWDPNSELNRICREHDQALEAGEIDF